MRLTPKPATLIERIARMVDRVDGVEHPHTLAIAAMEGGGRTWTVHVCTWIGKGAADRGNPFGLGQDIARLHEQLAHHGGAAFTDQTLIFERGPAPTSEQELPTWYVARHLWRDRIFPQLADTQRHLRPQPIHGYLHWDNVVAGRNGGFGFIDFDKIMHAPPVFDLAKLLATGFFTISAHTRSVRFQRSRAADLLAGYRSIRQLADAELTALEGFAVIVNEETARLGHVYDVVDYRLQAAAVGDWWLARRRRQPSDPLGIHKNMSTSPPPAVSAEQLPLLDTEPEPQRTESGPATTA
ncbi:phosphotransferase enzyme family protein [Nonomuraea sp. NPDC003754]